MIGQEAAFLRVLQAEREQIPEKDALYGLREKAWEKFLSMGLPSKSDEAFRSVALRDLYLSLAKPGAKGTLEEDIAESIAQAVIPECRHSHVVFVNGEYRPLLSDTSALDVGCTVHTLSQAMRISGHFLTSHLIKGIKEEKDPFALLNLALHPQGLFLYIAPKQCLAFPIQCIQIITRECKSFSAARIQLALGAQSDVKWISTHLALNTDRAHCSSPLIDLYLNEGAHLDFIGNLSILASNWCFDSIRAHLKRDAILKVLNIIGGSKATRQNIYVECAGVNSEADVKGIWMLRENLRAHAYVTIDHQAPHTRSMQLFKGILLDASQSSFEGKIIVRQLAQKTEAYQLNNNLLLGAAAIAHSKPHLEIFADDVKASHGATITRPDAAQLFYLKSRGIEEKQAKNLLMHGFYQEVLDQIPYMPMRKQIADSMRGGIS